MKALSIRQPWAWLIIQGHKDVENRTWRTDYRGPLLIHAGYIFDHDGYEFVKREMGLALPSPEKFKRGGIVGIAEIRDCVTSSPSKWFAGPYGFIMMNPRLLPFIAVPGKPGIFDADVPTALKGLLDAVSKEA